IFHRDQNAARIRTIVRTRSMHYFLHKDIIRASVPLKKSGCSRPGNSNDTEPAPLGAKLLSPARKSDGDRLKSGPAPAGCDTTVSENENQLAFSLFVRYHESVNRDGKSCP